ncbi:MAG: FtsX-like permease family protein, partial [Gemmatimonadota bacterium]
MSLRWRTLTALAWRDTRTTRRRLVLSMSSIAIGVAALVAVDSYSADVVRSIHVQARGLLGADLSVTAHHPLPAPALAMLDTLRTRGAKETRVTTFSSMALVSGGKGTRLVQVRAMGAGAPYYGVIETSPPDKWKELQRAPNAIVDSALLIALDAKIGDTLSLGYARFAIIATLRNVPGDVGIAAALGPRVYIPDQSLAETKLLGFGSRADYESLIKLPATIDADAFAKSHRELFDSLQLRAKSVADTERSLTRSIEQLGRFLGLVGLIALLLGGTGVASALRAYMAEKIDTIAVLRCLGASAAQVVWMFIIEAAGLGFAGALLGVVLGVAAQLVLPHVLGTFIPVDVVPQLELVPALSGLALGTWVGILFALGPVLGVRNVAPLQVLRRDDSASAARSAWRDPLRIVAALVLVASVVAVCIARADSAIVGLWMSAGITAAIGATWLAAMLCARAARRLAQLPWRFVVRHGIANLDRPGNQTRPVVLALGFGAFLLGTLALVQGNLLRQIASTADASAANLAFFDVQTDQAAPLDSMFSARSLPTLSQTPIVPMRIAGYTSRKPKPPERRAAASARAAGGEESRDGDRARPSWAVRREYRSSYRDSVASSEKIIAGTWWSTPGPDADGFFEISVEQSLAEELGVIVGDTITWDVQGVRIRSRITSLREVQWARFEPNFFVVFQPAALREAPQSFVLLTRVNDDGARATLQRDAVLRFPNVSTIDLSLIEKAVGKILARVSLAVRFMALFSVVTGILVLVSAVAASRRQRVRESVLLKTLGATRAQIVRMLFTEYALLGAIGSLAGILLAVGGGWAAVHFIFKAPFTVSPLALIVVAALTMLLTIVTGLFAARDVFAETPMAAL